MSATTHGQSPYYFVPAPSKWPMVGAISMFFFMLGMSGTVNDAAYGPYSLALSFAILTYMFFGWFATVIHESEAGQYNHRVDASFRWSMSWFIFSEVMFFAAFLAPCSTPAFLRCPGSVISTTRHFSGLTSLPSGPMRGLPA